MEFTVYGRYRLQTRLGSGRRLGSAAFACRVAPLNETALLAAKAAMAYRCQPARLPSEVRGFLLTPRDREDEDPAIVGLRPAAHQNHMGLRVDPDAYSAGYKEGLSMTLATPYRVR